MGPYIDIGAGSAVCERADILETGR